MSLQVPMAPGCRDRRLARLEHHLSRLGREPRTISEPNVAVLILGALSMDDPLGALRRAETWAEAHGWAWVAEQLYIARMTVEVMRGL